MEIEDYHEHRRKKDEFFRTGEKTPLGPGDHSAFDGLDYYGPDPMLVFEVPVTPGDGSEVRVATSDDREKVYTTHGTVALDIRGVPVELTVYDTPHGLFLPFRDATSGEATYGAGRYLDLEPNADGTLTIDFNLAYNPSCVYSDGWSCPIPPRGNWLDIPIEAGEKMYLKASSPDP
jgi:uncharacterized protein (DUF1684 family)